MNSFEYASSMLRSGSRSGLEGVLQGGRTAGAKFGEVQREPSSSSTIRLTITEDRRIVEAANAALGRESPSYRVCRTSLETLKSVRAIHHQPEEMHVLRGKVDHREPDYPSENVDDHVAPEGVPKSSGLT